MEGGAKSGGRDGRRFYRSQSFTHGQSQIAFRIYTVLNIPRFCVFFWRCVCFIGTNAAYAY